MLWILSASVSDMQGMVCSRINRDWRPTSRGWWPIFEDFPMDVRKVLLLFHDCHNVDARW
jgi:hypothetical protein